MRQMGSSLCQ